MNWFENEMLRLIGLLGETDPRTDDYIRCLRSIESLDSIGMTINDFMEGHAVPQQECNGDCADCDKADDNVVDFPSPIEENPFPEEPPAEPEKPKKKRKKAEPAEEPEEPKEEPAPEEKEAPVLSAVEVRTKLAAARKAGVNVSALVKECGADNFTALPAGKYNELLKKVYEQCPELE